MTNTRSQNTRLTIRIVRGAGDAIKELAPLVYDELRSLARAYLGRQRVDHTLQPTALVHEAFLRLTNAEELDCAGRAHFICLAAKTMRAILVDHARRHNAVKRSGGRERVTLQGMLADEGSQDFELLDLHEALTRLTKVDARQAEIVELRFFGGLTGDEIAELKDLSRATVVRDLAMARAWLLRELDDTKHSGDTSPTMEI